MLDLKHGSKVDQLEAAARALGAHLEIKLVMEPSPRKKVAKQSPQPALRPMVHAGVIAAQKKAASRRSFAGGAKKK